jgi:hypothetical protein
LAGRGAGFFSFAIWLYERIRIKRMSTQDPLFHDDFNDALANAVKALGNGKIEPVARQLWGPAKRSPGQYLSDCLNPEREAKLSIPEIIQLLKWARERGIHWAMHALCEEVGYRAPDVAPVMTERQKRARRRVELAQEMQRLADEEAADTNQLKAVQ